MSKKGLIQLTENELSICQDEIRRKKAEKAKRKTKKKVKSKVKCTGYYAVYTGRINDCIVRTWEECKSLTHYYPNAIFKKFDTQKAAEKYLKDHRKKSKDMYYDY